MTDQHQLTTQRFSSLDSLRGLAVLGILLMNIQSFGQHDAAYLNPHALGPLTGVDIWLWKISFILFNVKFISLFAMMFGAGVVLQTQRLEAKQVNAWDIHKWRMLWLGVFGLIHGVFIWSGDILLIYAISGLLVFSCRYWSTRKLLTVGVIIIVMVLGLDHATYTALEESPAELDDWLNTYWQPTPTAIAEDQATFTGDYSLQLMARLDELFITYLYMGIFIIPTVVGLMMLGMACFKTGVFTAEAANRVYIGLICLALLVGLPITLASLIYIEQSNWEPVSTLSIGYLLLNSAAPLVAFCWAAPLLISHKLNRASWLHRYLIPVGQLAFSNYLLQSLICTLFFNGFGFYGQLSLTILFFIVLVVWTILFVWSNWWVKHFYYGPAEWLWRTLAYRKRQPFKK
ncbi:DUF418 domain-containing protein [Endozoicomonas sp. SM1973]|uniref:DUF418 domain-containing protein n=1 Tax=Spartinivicinus marinus TaxID=2994442 RepID=A0A853IG08_9GAMM|nr:DUF418 domain-containing protein [Spartinivicinus marinus]MCX4024622.1 DUF418 domain-containing protein [Spartinivicinus marinus]NYZ69478.1 DUF418 domain-containing protein [Spartinivicinus marinus]